MIEISLLGEEESHGDRSWDDFVLGNPDATPYHLSAWRHVFRECYGLKTAYLTAYEGNERLVGILPLVLFRSRFFGRFYISLPYLNYGGLVVDGPYDGEAGQLLLEEASILAQHERAKHVELRHGTPGNFSGWRTKTAKVAMLLDLPADPEQLWKGFKAKLRSQIRRPVKEGMRWQMGGEDLLDHFYGVFTRNMRDLGTPVHSKRFFRSILEKMTSNARIAIVFAGEQAVAAGFLVGFRNRLEIPWASSLRQFNRFSPNMMLYWQVLEYACGAGYTLFDFGRSSPDSGTFRFKKQWGAEPHELYWHYSMVDDDDSLPELNPSNPKYGLAIRLWRRLPLPVTRLLGPQIIRMIPG